MVLKVSFVCVNPGVGEWAGRGYGEGGTGKPGDHHDCNSMLKYLLELLRSVLVTAEVPKDLSKSTKHRGLEPCLAVI